ncbi:MAG: hypothetical protein KDL87_07660, partial [Verrucomicrobiae bacterium]|nr:hypothetical protein [Verrucomicrobiae bacterium]
GKHDYNEWLCKSRAKAVQQAFLDAGIPEDRLSIEIVQPSAKSDHLSKVMILIPRSEPPTTALLETADLNLPDPM